MAWSSLMWIAPIVVAGGALMWSATRAKPKPGAKDHGDRGGGWMPGSSDYGDSTAYTSPGSDSPPDSCDSGSDLSSNDSCDAGGGDGGGGDGGGGGD